MDLNSFMGDEPADGVNIIDASNVIIATISANYAKADNVQFTEGMVRHLILDTIRNNVTKQKDLYPEAIIAFDAPDRGYWRRDVAYYYKKNRAKAREESKIDWELIFPWINKVVQEMCIYYPQKCIHVKRAEADDIIGVLTKYFSEMGRPVMITSVDGDFTQLHKHKGVKQYSPTLKKAVKPKHGSAHNDLMIKLVKGDKKDCVAPIKCRGDYYLTRVEGERAPSASTKWVNELSAAVNAEDLLSGDLLERYKENRMLLDLDYIPDYIRDQIIDAYKNAKPGARNRFYSYMVKSGLSKLLASINLF